MTGRKVTVNVIEIKDQDRNAFLVGEAMAEQLCKRALSGAGDEAVLRCGDECRHKGVKIMCSGRLGGAEMPDVRRRKKEVSRFTLWMRMLIMPRPARDDIRNDRYQGVDISGSFSRQQESRQAPRRRPFGRDEGSGGPATGHQRRSQAGSVQTDTAASVVERPEGGSPQGS